MSVTTANTRPATPGAQARSLHRRFAPALLAALMLAGAGFSAATHASDGKDHGERHERMAQRMAERQAALKNTLKIKPNQEAAWQQFTAAMQMGKPAARPDREQMQRLTTPERIDRMQALRAEHNAEMDKRALAVKALYAALDAEQRKVLDSQRLMVPGGPDGHGGPGGKGERRGEHGMHKMPG